MGHFFFSLLSHASDCRRSLSLVDQAKNNACFGKGHPQMIRTVRVPEEGQRGMVDTRGVAPLHAHFYFRLKPGSVRPRGRDAVVL